MVWSGLVMVSRVVPLYYLTPVSPYCYVKYWGSDLTVVTPGQIWSFNNLDNWIYTSDDIWWYLRYPSICWINKIKRNLCSSASNHHTCFSSSPPASLAEEKFGQVEFVEYTTLLQHGIYMYYIILIDIMPGFLNTIQYNFHIYMLDLKLTMRIKLP